MAESSLYPEPYDPSDWSGPGTVELVTKLNGAPVTYHCNFIEATGSFVCMHVKSIQIGHEFSHLDSSKFMLIPVHVVSVIEFNT